MITLEQTADGRTMRVFLGSSPDANLSRLKLWDGHAEFWNEEDREREPLLRTVLSRDAVRALAYPTVGHPDVLQVFLRSDTSDDDLLFACTLISGQRLHSLLEEQDHVAEGFALQVAPGTRLTMEGVRAAVLAWIERCFPDVTPPNVVVDVWTEADGIPEDMLQLLVAAPPAEKPARTAPKEHEPDPDLADPPYEDVA